MSEEKVIHNYPSNISNIGYASFLEIKRWSYDRAKATVMRDFNDAAGSIQDTNIMQQASVFGKGVLEKIKGISSGKSLVDEYERGLKKCKIPESV